MYPVQGQGSSVQGLGAELRARGDFQGAQQAQAPTRIGGIPQTFSEVEQMSTMVYQGLAQLRERLEQGGALRPSSPQTDVGNAKLSPSSPVSGIVGRLRDQQNQLASAGAILADVLDRLDL